MSEPWNKGQKLPPEILTATEAERLIKTPSVRYPTGLRNRGLLAVMYGAGLRVSEALALRPSDVDLDGHSLRVLHGKGDKARTVGIDAGALLHVSRWIDKRRALGLKARGPLFCTLQGTELSDRYVRELVARLADKAGIDKRVNPHALRHTHAVELEREGFTVTEIQHQLGHSNLNTTAVYLNHISPSARINKIANRRDSL